jgi:drug/metabolite transporter (DMT)-like permease
VPGSTTRTSWLRVLTDSRASNGRGILFMVAATLCFAVMGVTARHVAERIHPFEVVFFRVAFGFVLLVPIVARYGLAHFRTDRFGLHCARAGLQVAEMLMFFTGLTLIQYAQVQALTFTTPMFATLLAVLLLGEQVRRFRIVGLLIGFAGALIVVRPGIVPVETGSLLILVSALGWSGVIVMVKTLTRTDSSLTITAWMIVLMSPIALIPALFVWVWPTWMELGWLALAGLTGTLGQLAVAQAFRLADTTAVLPFDFLKLVWAALLAYLLFGEVPTFWIWLGGCVIFAGGLYLTVCERGMQEVARHDPRPDVEAPRPRRAD